MVDYITILNNKIPINYYEKENKYIFSDIHYTDKMDRNLVWSIYVIDDKIHRESCIGGGKVRVYDPIQCIGKNQGRKNETSSHEQAMLEAWSMWKKKSEQVSKSIIFPMLAHNYSKHKEKLIPPFAISRKIDGIRAISQRDFDQHIILTSRLGNPFTFLESIKSDLEYIYKKYPSIILDGEIYSHDISFQRISGAVRSSKKKSEDDHFLEYWIFDIVSDNSYKERMKLLKDIQRVYETHSKHHCLKFIYYDEVVSRSEVELYHNIYVKEGFEGAICRNFDSKYLKKFRSYDLQKYKNFEDTEFKIIGTKEGRGSEKGAILFECECVSGVFDVRPRGSIEKRKDMWRRREEYIGKMLTVRYQNTGIKEDSDLPRFPVGIEIRDYE